ncbi:MAG: hypothetical protein F6K19_49050, partial [Cyanothece sp. SIO1E1]|nr:hypothetical protein [Cyanothece sp. SIO1E1]
MKLHTRLFLLLSSALVPLVTIELGLAQTVRPVLSSHAQGLNGAVAPVVKVWSGSGVNINFLATGETIIRAWIDDPAKIVLDFDEPLCSDLVTEDCQGGNPSIIRLRRVTGLNFSNLPSAPSTLLTVVTEAPAGLRRLYNFRVETGVGTPEYHTITMMPDAAGRPVIVLSN